jgi:hypothetical protein
MKKSTQLAFDCASIAKHDRMTRLEAEIMGQLWPTEIMKLLVAVAPSADRCYADLRRHCRISARLD